MYLLFYLLQVNYITCLFYTTRLFNNILHTPEYAFQLAMKTTPVLTNLVRGGFGFSERFLNAFEKTYHTSVPFYDLYSQQILHDNNGIEARYDERIIDIYHQLGAKESAGEYCVFSIDYVPNKLLPYIYIRDDDGEETLWVNVSEYYKDLLCKIIESPDKTITENHLLEIQNMKNCEAYLYENYIHYL